MESFLTPFKDFILNLLFPKFCLGCKKEGNYLCKDCFSTIEITDFQFCPGCHKRVLNGRICESCRKFVKLDGLYSATSYQNHFVKELINKFKYKPLIKELTKPLASLIIAHFLIIEKQKFPEFSIIPIPLDKKRLRWRGFNQAKEIAMELANFLKIPVLNEILIKIKRTFPQVEIKDRERRKENILGVFSCKEKERIKGKKILLVDDVYTTGSTMNEAARVLKEAGAKEVWGVVIARG